MNEIKATKLVESLRNSSKHLKVDACLTPTLFDRYRCFGEIKETIHNEFARISCMSGFLYKKGVLTIVNHRTYFVEELFKDITTNTGEKYTLDAICSSAQIFSDLGIYNYEEIIRNIKKGVGK